MSHLARVICSMFLLFAGADSFWQEASITKYIEALNQYDEAPRIRKEMNQAIRDQRQRLRRHQNRLMKELRAQHKMNMSLLNEEFQKENSSKKWSREERAENFKRKKARRQVVLKQHTEERKRLRQGHKAETVRFEIFVKKQQDTFKKKRLSLKPVHQKKSGRQRDPVLDEFKEIPSGGGIRLSPFKKSP